MLLERLHQEDLSVVRFSAYFFAFYLFFLSFFDMFAFSTYLQEQYPLTTPTPPPPKYISSLREENRVGVDGNDNFMEYCGSLLLDKK